MRPRRILKLTLSDEARLQTLASLTITPVRILAIAALALVTAMVVGFLLVLLTPLKTLIPGYMRESQRAASELALLRVDSLQEAYIRNQAYVENLNRVMDIERQAVRSRTVADSARRIIPADSLLPPSAEESRFVRRMQEREKFNISVVAPMAAEGMLFYPVCDDGIVTGDSKNSLKAILNIPADASIMAMADGNVVALYYDPKRHGYTLIMQHDNGFLSRYTGLGSPLVGEADEVLGGQVLCLTPAPRNGHPAEISVELWHDAIRIPPYSYISSPHTYTPLYP